MVLDQQEASIVVVVRTIMNHLIMKGVELVVQILHSKEVRLLNIMARNVVFGWELIGVIAMAVLLLIGTHSYVVGVDIDVMTIQDEGVNVVLSYILD